MGDFGDPGVGFRSFFELVCCSGDTADSSLGEEYSILYLLFSVDFIAFVGCCTVCTTH